MSCSYQKPTKDLAHGGYGVGPPQVDQGTERLSQPVRGGLEVLSYEVDSGQAPLGISDAFKIAESPVDVKPTQLQFGLLFQLALLIEDFGDFAPGEGGFTDVT